MPKRSFLEQQLLLHSFSGQDNLGKPAPEKQNHSGKTNLDLLEHETVSGSGISWAICKSAHRLRQITMPTPHHSVFYRPDALPAAQPTASKHSNKWKKKTMTKMANPGSPGKRK